MRQLFRTVQEKLAPSIAADRDALGRRVHAVQSELEQVKRERDELTTQTRDAFDRRHMDRILHHHPWRLAGESGVVQNVAPRSDDTDLLKRVTNAYRSAVMTPVGSAESFWLNEIANANANAHEILMDGDFATVATLIRDPAKSMLLYGFSSIQSRDVPNNADIFWVAWNHRLAYDALVQLSRATGNRPIENPDTNEDYDDAPGVEVLLEKLDDTLGFKVDFPNPFAGEVGLQTSRGVANYRAVYSLYQAWRTAVCLRGVDRPRVLEIGVGLGAPHTTLQRWASRTIQSSTSPLPACHRATILEACSVTRLCRCGMRIARLQ